MDLAYSPGAYLWATDPKVTDYALGGCLTLVTGRTFEMSLAVVSNGQMIVQMPYKPATRAIYGCDLPSLSGEMGSVLVEQVTLFGLDQSVLAALSSLGKAVNVTWDVNDVVAVSFAELGIVLASLEMPVIDEGQVSGMRLPDDLVPYLSAEQNYYNPVAVSFAMAEHFSGLHLTPGNEVTQPTQAYAIAPHNA